MRAGLSTDHISNSAPEDVGLSLLASIPLSRNVPNVSLDRCHRLIVVVGHSLLRLWLTSLASAVTGNIPELVGDYMYERYQRKQAV